MQMVSLGDNLHEMSRPILCEGKKKKERNAVNLSTADCPHRLVNVKQMRTNKIQKAFFYIHCDINIRPVMGELILKIEVTIFNA